MFKRRRQLAEYISPTNTSINLPRTSLIDAIVILPQVTVSNSDATNSYNVTNETLLRKIREIRIQSDGGNTHYAIDGLSAFLMSYYKTKGNVAPLSTSTTVPASGSATINLPPIMLDEGDIFGLAHNSVTAQAVVDPTIDANLSITDFRFKILIEELVGEKQEYLNLFGPNLERLAEVKVTKQTASLQANTSPEVAVNLPVGNVVVASMMITEDSAGVLSDSVVNRVELTLETTGTTLMTAEWGFLKEVDRLQYALNPHTGVAIINYDEDVFQNGLGLIAVDLGRGDVTLRTQNASAGKLTVVNVEWVPYNKEALPNIVGEA